MYTWDLESVYSQLFLCLFHRMLQNYEHCDVGSPTVSLSSITEHFEVEKNSFVESLTNRSVAKIVANVWGSKVCHKRMRLSRGGKQDINLRKIDDKDRLRETRACFLPDGFPRQIVYSRPGCDVSEWSVLSTCTFWHERGIVRVTQWEDHGHKRLAFLRN